MNKQVMIEVLNLSKSYKGVEVLKGINLQVEKGSIFALLGSNGAGKTTTIKILSTLLKPDGGEVRLAGFDVVKKTREVKKHIALTGQYAAVDETLTGRENLIMVGKLLHVKNTKEKAENLLRQYDLLEQADRRVSTYSGGMKRKIDIAMSLMGTPNIIFLDEPTTGLDPQSRKAMWKSIKQLSETGVTIFLTTQYLDEADELADNIAILDKGQIIAEGTNNELKDVIPSNIIELYFSTVEEIEKAKLLLNKHNPSIVKNSNRLRLEIHDSVNEVIDIFNKLKGANVEIENFEKKKASMEDVFLKVIGHDEEGRVLDANNNKKQ